MGDAIQLANYPKVTVTLTTLSLVFALLAQSVFAEPTVFESATMGTPGQGIGFGLSDTQILGSRFHIDQTVEITKIGGHLYGSTSGNAFGAIISLSGPDALPTGSPFNGPEVLASTIFNAGYPSNDFRTNLNVTLPPGDYALILGAGYFGADSGSRGGMPNNNSDLPGSSYFSWSNSNWSDSISFSNTRFVVEGTIQSLGTINGFPWN